MIKQRDEHRARKKSRDSSVGIATGYGLKDRMMGVRSPGRWGLGIFLFDTMSSTDWPPGARTANGTSLCHYVQLYR
jgi:hypothetical protein